MRFDHGVQAGGHGAALDAPVAVTGADAAGAEQCKMLLRKRAAQCHGPGFGQAAEIPVIPGRAKRCAEQHGRPPAGKILSQEGAWVEAEHGGPHHPAVGADLQYIVFVKTFGHPQPAARIKIKLQQRGVGFAWLTVVVQPDFQRLTKQAQRMVKRFGAALLKKGRPAGRGRQFVTGGAPAAKNFDHPAQRGFQPASALTQRLARRCEGCVFKRRAVHIPRAVGQVVRFVDEKEVVPLRFKKALQPHGRVEQVVVISDDDVAPKAQIEPQLKRADREPARQRGQRFGPKRTVGPAFIIQCGGQGFLDAGIVAVGIWAGLGGTFTGFAQANFILGGQRHAAHRQAGGGCTQPGERVLGCGAGGAAGGQVEYRPANPGSQRFERPEQHAHRFADAGRRLAEQLPAARGRSCTLRRASRAGLVGIRQTGRRLRLAPPCGRAARLRPAGPRVRIGPAGRSGSYPEPRLYSRAQTAGRSPRQSGSRSAAPARPPAPVAGPGSPHTPVPGPSAQVRGRGGDLGRGQGGCLDFFDNRRPVLSRIQAVGPALQGVTHAGAVKRLAQGDSGGNRGARGRLRAAACGAALRPRSPGQKPVNRLSMLPRAQQKLHQPPHRERDGQRGRFSWQRRGGHGGSF